MDWVFVVLFQNNISNIAKWAIIKIEISCTKYHDQTLQDVNLDMINSLSPMSKTKHISHCLWFDLAKLSSYWLLVASELIVSFY